MSNPVDPHFPILQGAPISAGTRQQLFNPIDPQILLLQTFGIDLLQNIGIQQALQQIPHELRIDQIIAEYLKNVLNAASKMREDEEKEDHLKKREAVESQSNESQKGKKLREDQYEVLHKFFERKQNVTREEAEQLSAQLGVAVKKIRQWFVTKRRSNRRKEEKRKAREVEGCSAPFFNSGI